jgi:hypothetical protein
MRTRRARIHFFFPWVTHDEFFLFDYDDANIALGGYTNTEYFFFSVPRKAA